MAFRRAYSHSGRSEVSPSRGCERALRRGAVPTRSNDGLAGGASYAESRGLHSTPQIACKGRLLGSESQARVPPCPKSSCPEICPQLGSSDPTRDTPTGTNSLQPNGTRSPGPTLNPKVEGSSPSR